MRRTAGGAAVVLALAGCGTSDRERVEQGVRDQAVAAGPIRAVDCRAASRMWGCTLRLRDGRTQACQATVDRDAAVEGVACQPLRGE